MKINRKLKNRISIFCAALLCSTSLNVSANSELVTDKWTNLTVPFFTNRTYPGVITVDDRIYVIGGVDESYTYEEMNLVEMYDPKTKTLETKAGMPTPRQEVIISELNGKIYAMGGISNYNTSDAVEVYDIETNTWEEKRNMSSGRKGANSIALDNKIYLFGGEDFNNRLVENVDIYNPEQDSWETGAEMPNPRKNFVSALIGNKIYCIGGTGSSGNGKINAIDIYDPAQNSWETKASKVLDIGNCEGGVAVNNKIYIFSSAAYDKMVLNIYNPEEDTWETGEIINGYKGFGYGVTAVGDKIYIIAGTTGRDGNYYYDYYPYEIDIFDTQTNKWTKESINPIRRAYLTTAVVNDKLYCIGGLNGITAFDRVEMYDFKTNTWETKRNMLETRRSATSAVVDDKIYVIGGMDNDWSHQNTVEMYNPETNEWIAKSSMSTARYETSSAVVGNKIYVFGGEDNSYSAVNTVEMYDPEKDEWVAKASMPTKRRAFISLAVGNKIYCIGGYDENYNLLNSVDVYNTESDEWETGKAQMPTSRAYLTGSVIDGKIYAIGGEDESECALNTVEVYNPETDAWKTKTSLSVPRVGLSSVVIDGKIFAIGGRFDKATYFNTMEVYLPGDEAIEEATDAVTNAEKTLLSKDIAMARLLVNNLPESTVKDQLQIRLNNIFVTDTTFTPKSATANLDIYIKSENMLSLSLSTNSITFEDFGGTENLEELNAVNLTINSSLPYKVDAYLATEIQNADKNKTMDKEILNIKANGTDEYKTFSDIGVTPITLLDTQEAGNNKTHGIDIMLKGGIPHEKDIYKTTIKFEATQK